MVVADVVAVVAVVDVVVVAVRSVFCGCITSLWFAIASFTFEGDRYSI